MFVAAGLFAPATAAAGGFATVGVTPPPQSAAPGTPWHAEVTILQHGRTPLDGVKPSITIARTSGGGERTFAARPTGRPGVYRARVVFPAAGRWTYVVDDGFSARHEFPAVVVGGPGATASGPAAAAGDGIDVWLAIAVALAAGVLAALLTLQLGRRTAGRAATVGG